MINADKKKEMKNLIEMLLETRGLTKRYGHHKAVDSVSMHIKKGAIYGFIGRNGAGKTTCLKMISGLSRPTSGEIEIFGYKAFPRYFFPKISTSFRFPFASNGTHP